MQVGGKRQFEKLFVIAIASLALMSLAVYALSGISTSVGERTRWSGLTAGSIATEGGNITHSNVTSVSLTDRWAAFFGNVTGGIALTNGSSTLYSWTWALETGGEVCLSENSTLPIESSFTTASASNINTAFGHGSAADNATNTYEANNCSLVFSQATVTNTAYAKHKDHSSFYTCPVYDGTGGSAKADYLFCTNISNGTTYHNLSYNYEVLVPTAPGTGSETYYFYAEFG